jgi:tetratricopeptide (TPR) repeat protein
LNRTFGLGYSQRALVLQKQGKQTEAVADLKTADSVAPNDPEVLCAKGYFLVQTGELKRAIECYEKAIRLDSCCFLGYQERGMTYLTLGMANKATQDFDTALRLRPYDAVTYLLRASAFYKGGDLEEALKDCNRAIEIDGGSSEGLVKRGYLFLKMRDWNKAIADFTKVIQLEPNRADVHAMRARAYRGAGLPDEAARDERRSKELRR